MERLIDYETLETGTDPAHPAVMLGLGTGSTGAPWLRKIFWLALSRFW